ncbi:Dolichyldiphosphatase 1 [Rhizoclosmatium sp. JEL0117]|nr:Dolichyldiphosphatase 1 [Rhizoclosmatium sp. JEL0117]
MPAPTSLEGLKPFSFTFFLYDPNDPIGKLMALMSLTPIFIMVSYATLIAARRDLYIASICLGQLIGEVLNLALKKLIKEPRPTAILGGGYGMPSSHSQFMAYFATCVILHLYLKTSYKSKLWKHLIAFATLLLAASVQYSRIHLYYHTPSQVLVGVQIGTLLGLIWFLFTTRLLLPFLVDTLKVLDHPLAIAFCVRDTSDVGDLVRCEYEGLMKWEREVGLRGRGLAGTGVGKSAHEKTKGFKGGKAGMHGKSKDE